MDFRGSAALEGRFLGFGAERMGVVAVYEGDAAIPANVEEYFAPAPFIKPSYRSVAWTVCEPNGAFEVTDTEPGIYTVVALTAPPPDSRWDLSQERLS